MNKRDKHKCVSRSSIHRFTLLAALSALLVIALSSCSAPQSGNTLRVFCGSAVKPVMEKLAMLYEEKTGIRAEIQYGGSGVVLSMMQLARRGDIFISGSPDFMEKAKRMGLVHESTEQILAYLIPAIIVQKGNPKGIVKLEDLAAEDVSLGIANPDSVCLGIYAFEIFDNSGILDRVRGNIKVFPESCSKTAAIIVMNKVDAVIGWREFQNWGLEAEVVLLKPDEIPRIAYVTAAASSFTTHLGNADSFIKYLVSEEARSVFEDGGYFTRRRDAAELAPNATFGGEYKLAARPGAG